MNLPLAFRLARRELRQGLSGFRLFLGCLAIGVAAIAGVGTVSEAVVAGLHQDARRLLGGDMEFRLVQRPASVEQRRWLADRAGSLSEMIEMRAMVKPEGDNRRAMVEVKGVDGLHPLAGRVESDPPLALEDALGLRDGAFGAIVDGALLTKLGLSVGDRVRVGAQSFRIAARLVREPDEIGSVFDFGPRFLISLPALEATGLILPGARIQYHYRVTLASGDNGKAFTEAANQAWPDAGWRVRGLDNASPGAERFVERLTLFLNFVGLTALLVGGIGVGNAVRAHLETKTATIATFKCLGAPAVLVFATYLAQVLVLALAGIGIGLAFGTLLPLAALGGLKGVLPVDPVVAFYPLPLVTALVFGLVIAVTFALWPLARARATPAAALFRDARLPGESKPTVRDGLAVTAGALGLAALVLLTASDKGFALWFVGGSATALAALSLGARLVAALAARAPKGGPAALRLAIANLHRRGSSAPTVVRSLGLGLAVLVAVALIQGNIGHQVNERLPDEAPAFFFIDIQPDQVARFDEMIRAETGARDLQRMPTLRGRIVAIAGVPVEQAQVDPDVAWALRGDRALTYAVDRPEGADIVEGQWWPRDYAGPPLISFDAKVARGFGVGVGDKLTVNVLGREIEAEIASLRAIDWRSLRFDFAIIFAPGSLEGAPHTHLAAIKADHAAEDRIEQKISAAFANVSVIRVRDALEAAAAYLDGISWAVRGTSAITLLAGGLVLAGAIAATRRSRLREAVVFKVVGATRARIALTYLLEYGLLGLVTGLVAAAIGTLTAWAVIRFLMQADWVFLPATVLWVTLICVVLTLIVGFAGTWKALGEKAAPYLRNE
ncbi:MAG: ABC transporter permease [Rhodospirillales bacterium]